MDTAIKAEWYDIDDADRARFLTWLHERHLPALQARPGHIWIGHYNRAPQTGASNPPGYPARVETDDPKVPRGPHAGGRICPRCRQERSRRS